MTHLQKWDKSKEALRTSLNFAEQSVNFKATMFLWKFNIHTIFSVFTEKDRPSVLVIILGSVFRFIALNQWMSKLWLRLPLCRENVMQLFPFSFEFVSFFAEELCKVLLEAIKYLEDNHTYSRKLI